MAAVCTLMFAFFISTDAGTIYCDSGFDCNVLCKQSSGNCLNGLIRCPDSPHKCTVTCDISGGTGQICEGLTIGKYHINCILKYRALVSVKHIPASPVFHVYTIYDKQMQEEEPQS